MLYGAEGETLWASGSGYEGVGSPFVVVQDDGNVCLYDDEVEGRHWETGTAQ